MAVRGVSLLQAELEKAKDGLKSVDDSIAKVTGWDSTDQRGPRRVRGADEFRGRERIIGLSRRGMEDGPSPAKRRAIGGAFSRLGPPRVVASRLGPRPRDDSGDEDDFGEKPSIQSSVVATPKEARSREQVAEDQSKDQGSQQRNRRMFGLLLGTLRKFKDEEKDKTDKERKRQEIEKKLEEKAKAEQDVMKKERQELFKERNRKQAKIKQLEQKMELVGIHEEWESQTKMLANFIRTKSKPHLYYMPKSHTGTSEKRLKDTKKVLQDIIEERRRQLEEEIEQMTASTEGLPAEQQQSKRPLEPTEEHGEESPELVAPSAELLADQAGVDSDAEGQKEVEEKGRKLREKSEEMEEGQEAEKKDVNGDGEESMEGEAVVVKEEAEGQDEREGEAAMKVSDDESPREDAEKVAEAAHPVEPDEDGEIGEKESAVPSAADEESSKGTGHKRRWDMSASAVATAREEVSRGEAQEGTEGKSTVAKASPARSDGEDRDSDKEAPAQSPRRVVERRDSREAGKSKKRTHSRKSSSGRSDGEAEESSRKRRSSKNEDGDDRRTVVSSSASDARKVKRPRSSRDSRRVVSRGSDSE